jgi:hypothetical protein
MPAHSQPRDKMPASPAALDENFHAQTGNKAPIIASYHGGSWTAGDSGMMPQTATLFLRPWQVPLRESSFRAEQRLHFRGIAE